MPRITQPGKFEGETDLIVYLWDLGLQGASTDTEYDDFDRPVEIFELDDDDRAQFPDDHYNAFAIALTEDDNGFVHSQYFDTENDLTTYRNELAAGRDRVEAEANEPADGDITTEDHKHFYQYGKLVLEPEDEQADDPTVWIGKTARTARFRIHATDYRAALKAFMARTQFYPNCWVISDHGNAHLIDLSGGK